MENLNEVAIQPKPWPVFNQKYADSIDWTALDRDPFSYSLRYGQAEKRTERSNKSHIPNERQKISV